MSVTDTPPLSSSTPDDAAPDDRTTPPVVPAAGAHGGVKGLFERHALLGNPPSDRRAVVAQAERGVDNFLRLYAPPTLRA